MHPSAGKLSIKIRGYLQRVMGIVSLRQKTAAARLGCEGQAIKPLQHFMSDALQATV